MKLRKLILQGFKSFAEKTEFNFQDGITVIVGPNGCGKSNIVDAVKWVLGEQRPSSLRGKEMQDVIFSGTDSRKGLGFAEVSLVLDNAGQQLPLDFEEVVVTRRLYRSGESEYLLNGNRVRLRDVRELLMDSGGGPGALTVMEQGNIDRLLRADPRERRLVFEEAAGIAKYRNRRKETQRKLERTAENLARMRDMLAEYETRQRSLKIQAGKARRWREFTEELKKKRVTGALSRYAALSRRRESAQAELEEIMRLETEARATLESAVDQGADARKELDGLRERVSRGEAEMAALVAEQRAGAEKRAAREREANELETRAGDADRACADAERRATALGSDLAALKDEHSRADTENEARAQALRAAEALLDEVAGRVRLLREGRDALDLKRTEAFAAETEARNEEVACAAEVRALRQRRDRLEERAATQGEELVAQESARDEAALAVRKGEERLRSLEDRAQAAEQGGREARAEAEEAAREQSRLAGEAASLATRREMLQGLVQRGEGLSAGTRALLESGLPGIRGTLAELIGDAGGHAAALDQALGELAGAVVVATTEDALRAIRWLKEGERGRARLIPVDRLGEAPLPPPFTGLKGETAPLLGALLKGVRVVETVADALAEGRGARVIALTGEVFESGGSIVGGTGDAGAGLVLRHAELAEVGARLETSEQARAQAERRLAQARARAMSWDEKSEELKPRLREAREQVRLAGERLAAAENAVAARSDELALEKAERGEVEELLADCERRRAEARARLDEAARSRAALDDEASDLQARLTRAGRDREEAAGRQTEAKIEVARWREKAEAAAHRLRALEDAIGAARREAEARRNEASTCRTRRTECLDEVETLQRLSEERERQLTALGREVEERRAAARGVQEQLETGDVHVRKLRAMHEERREELERHRLRENELRLRVETLLEQVRRDYGLDLDRLELDEETAAADPEQLESEIEDLRSKIERLGNVNHTALEELVEVEEKITFLKREEADLLEADKQLRDTIDKIDDVCTTRFTQTFEQVREYFQVTFRKLFGGGRAEVFLENPEDVLESGIEIRVRPPGKELRNMALLSGGERSLTTVALLFSIYQTRPPPFCLLDEVDAALDEANTVRMCEMLKEFAEEGQFIIITHARPTMTVADRLYGVTMPEAGVSRHVSVKFADIEAGRVVGLN